MEYPEANRIWQLAVKSADQAIAQAKRENNPDPADPLVNPWKQARTISTVPLDTPVALVTKTPAFTKGNYIQIALSDVLDVQDDLSVTGKKDLAEGKVPLFYYKDFTIKLKNAANEEVQVHSISKNPNLKLRTKKNTPAHIPYLNGR